jgi:hypothetical protein
MYEQGALKTLSYYERVCQKSLLFQNLKLTMGGALLIPTISLKHFLIVTMQ